MKLEFAGQTDVGRKRGHNEDNFLILADYNLFLVADGMGGHSAGEVASLMAVESVAEFFKDTAEDQDVTWPFKQDKGLSWEENRLSTGVKLANLRIHESAASNSERRGMGTTLVCTYFSRKNVIIGHVGDSRVYRIRDRKIEMLTEDHSLLNDYLKMKELTQEEIDNFPHKNVIVRALGMKESVQVDVITDSPRIDDIYLLCSDGLSGMIEDPEVLQCVLDANGDLKDACQRLIDAANANGGVDNITCALIKVLQV
ncbi:MAG: Stp1/IreP family PP2C-type Ser/Thr phosphatase [Deltaproteobacteria bacterium]|nr:MAG: Stp1/IreP family PP2C-type Ser/Thr phosphatase [Deltaproteobacteria bacterium]